MDSIKFTKKYCLYGKVKEENESMLRKAKYIKMSPTQVKIYLYNTVLDDFKFEGPDSFTHLGSVLG